jgi:cation:H+ antiporter
MLISALTLVVGLVIVLWGAEWLVKGATRLAARFGVSPLVIGLTIVAFGTSTPELAISFFSVWRGQADIAVGNVIGSNIFNTLAILGLCSLLLPMAIEQKIIRVEAPLVIAASLVMWLMAANGYISVLEGVSLVACGIFYLTFAIVQSRRATAAEQASYDEEFHTTKKEEAALPKNLGLIVLGVALLAGGGHLLVEGAVGIARGFGISELVIGLTVVAFGTSVPELATSVVAALRKEKDIAVGNVLGSNLLNILFVLGFTPVFAWSNVNVSPDALAFDLPVMVATAVVCLPIFFSGNRIDRWEGGLLFFFYVAYTAFIVLGATGSALVSGPSAALYVFALPLGALTVLVLAWRLFQERGVKAEA